MYKKWNESDIREVLKQIGDKMNLSCENVPIIISNKMSTTKGQYSFKKKDFSPIRFKFSSVLLSGVYEAKTVRETIIHEYVHFYSNTKEHKNCGHNYIFKHNCKLAGIPGETYFNDNNETELSNKIQEKTSKYITECTCCGRRSYYNRMCGAISRTEEYSCGLCHGKLKRIK